MIYLDTNLKSLMITLAGAVAANQMDIAAHFYDSTPQDTTTLIRGGVQTSASNNTSDVTIVANPVLQGRIRNIHTLSINNKDTATATVTVKLDDNGVQKVLVKQSIAAGESLTYEDKAGFTILSPITPPFIDTTPIVKGSADATKQLRIEVDGVSASTVRVWTVADADIVVAGAAAALTTGRLVYSTTGGLLTADANALYNGSNITLQPSGTLTVNPTTLGNIDNTRIGFSTRAALQATTGDFNSTLAATGNFSINTNKFTVTASSGNTTLAGTLTVSGNTIDMGAAAATISNSSSFFVVRSASTLVLDCASGTTSELRVNNSTILAASSTGVAVTGTGSYSSDLTITTQSVGNNSTKAASTAFVSAFSQQITASLGADVNLNNTGTYFDGPSIAQGTSGTWQAEGTVTLMATTAGSGMYVKLWDGTTVIASAAAVIPVTSGYISVTLSGPLASPAGNIRISVKDVSSTDGKILFNQSGNSKDSTITAFKVAN